jgi:hypothetical protein
VEQQELKVSSEPTTEDPIISLKNEIQREREVWDQERKKVNKLLTEAQQDASQTTKFLKTILPRLNRLEETQKTSPKKNFVEDWTEDPESAVVSRVEDRVATVRDEIDPITEKQRKQDHKLALLTLRSKYQDFADLESRIAEISMSDPVSAQWSWTEEGLEKLYRVAREEKLSKMLDEKKADQGKDRAFTENSSGDNGNQTKGKKSLSPQEKRLCKQLGLTEKQYLENYLEGVEDAEV